MKLCVLHLIPTFGPGGAERQLSLLAPAMVAAGIECHVAFTQGGSNLARMEGTGVVLHQLPSRRNHDPRVIADLYFLIRRLNPTLVQTWLLQMDVMGAVAIRLAGLPQVLSERNSAKMYVNSWKMSLRAMVGRHVAGIVANSQGGLEYWRARGARGKLWLIRNALSPTVTSKPVDDLGLANVPLLIYAGRLSYEKNIPVLVDALVGALQQLPSHHAVLFGEGPLRGEAEQRMQISSVAGRLHLGGFTGELGYWLQRAQALISVSHFEGHPNVVIEAAAAGCPMVLSDIPAHREIADESAALFASPDDISSLVGHIVATASDRSAALKRAARAQAATADLDIDQAADNYVKFYRELVQ
jgi:glycosyltransferase involved in cell wall biosynthesis